MGKSGCFPPTGRPVSAAKATGTRSTSSSRTLRGEVCPRSLHIMTLTWID